MRLFLLWALLSCTTQALRHHDTHDYYAIHLDSTTPPSDLAAHLGLEYEGPLGELADHHLFRSAKGDGDVVEDAVQELKRRRRKRDVVGLERHVLDSVLLNQKQKLKPRMWKRGVLPSDAQRAGPAISRSRAAQGPPPVSDVQARRKEIAETLGIQDPIFNEQWHLFNTAQPGHDLNVTGLWLEGITGKNQTVCIIDDGLDMDSDDLRENYFAEGSYDFNDHADEPKPRLADDHHGTRCAGEVAALKNDVCGVGVAWDSKVSGIRILSKPITDADEAVAMNYGFQDNYIYSCSWGPPDDGRSMDAPGILIRRAMVNAVQKGRDGKGTVYVFAAGNGKASDDNCNFDGYTNSIYSITIGGIDKSDASPYYSEQCSAQLVVTYSSGMGDAIHTTDVGKNACTASHGGTSAAGPLAAAIYGLVLQVRPELTWRDLQWLTVLTAQPIDQDSDWQDTPIGKRYSHQFGFGKLNAWAIVEAAKEFELVKPQAWYHSPWIHVKHEIPQGAEGLASTFEVTEEMLKEANFERIEQITVTMNAKHTRRGDMSAELRSPSGIVSHIATARRNDNSKEGYTDWTFMSVVHWGEAGIGNWTVIVKDTNVNEHSGTFIDWRLKLWGECIDPASQSLLPMPNEDDDDDHDATTTAPVHTTTVSVSSTTSLPTIPTDHPERPVKPTATTTLPSTTPASATTTSTSTSTSLPDSFLPSPFPTFGVSKRTQVWIYGSLALILVFCASLATYFYLARRKRLRNQPRDNYEFERLDSGGGGGAGGVAGVSGGRGRTRRAGDLYDAFAGESDEEPLFSEDEREEEEERYHDDGDGGGGSGSSEKV